MKLQAHWKKHLLNFTFDAGTSRGILKQHQAYYIIIQQDSPVKMGLGEASPLKGLSIDDHPDFQSALDQAINCIQEETSPFTTDEVGDWVRNHIPAKFPSIRFGVETAWHDWLHGGRRLIFPHVFEKEIFAPIPINGLVWMGEHEFMLQQINEKIAQGFNCIKLKIGAIDFDTELSLLAHIRQHYSADQITLRIDANGAFSPDEALQKLARLAKYQLHSIEQPIAPNQSEAMRKLCLESPIPIALDEELIGINESTQAAKLLDTIQPQFIILKPTLLGGLSISDQWIQLAEERDIGWWMTSALESNVGLNAIAQFAAFKKVQMPQGLGTGQLYHNNIPSPLVIQQGTLHNNPKKSWDFTPILT
jgi:o-succinylbenzoate synthase